MENNIKIGIGAPTYNSTVRLERLLTSLYFHQDFNYSYRTVILDDGTPNQEMRLGVEELAKRFKVDFIQHTNNCGIPKSWNDLTRHFDTDISILFNDDICICNDNWLKCIVYALQNNEKVAAVGYPLIQIDPLSGLPNKNYSLPNYDTLPGRVGAVVGCCFAFKRKIFDEIGGFDENIKSFYEETDYGFQIAKLGYYSVMLPYPPIEHWGSQTFANNFELNIMSPDDKICSMEEYREIMSKKYDMSRIEPIPGKVYRMDYSRVYFAKKWGCKDYYDIPQVEVHHRLVDILPKLQMKYLDKNLKECICEI